MAAIRFHLVTLFQEACKPYLSASIVGRAQKQKYIKIFYQNPRDFVTNRWGKVDERPYGGGPGMVMTALPVVKSVKKALTARTDKKKIAIVWFVPGSKAFTNSDADRLAKFNDIVLVCGRYEGIDERALKIFQDHGNCKNVFRRRSHFNWWRSSCTRGHRCHNTQAPRSSRKGRFNRRASRGFARGVYKTRNH